MSRKAINHSQSENQRNHSLRFLRWFCPPELYESIEGDLVEQYEADLTELGKTKANWRLRWNVLRFFRTGIILRNRMSNRLTHRGMLKNNFKIAWRHIRRNPGYTGINVLGLVIGIASALIILSIIRFESSFDSFHTNASNIYRIVRVSQVEGQEEYRTGVVYPLPDAMKSGIPGLEKTASMLYWSWSGVQVDVPAADGEVPKKFQENSGFAIVEPAFFEVFDFDGTGFKWISGNAATALNEPNTVVLTRSMAMKYFPGGEAMGKTIRIDKDWDCKITGVVEDFPANSDFPFKLILSYATLKRDIAGRWNNWNSVGENQCYLVLPPSMSKEELEAAIEKVHAANVSEGMAAMRKYKLQPLSEVHKDIRFGNYNLRVVSDERLWTLGVVGLFLLIVACINYINLATAQAAQRSKEVGVCKVLGGARSGLVLQFMSEAFLVVLLAAVAGLVIAEATISNFQGLLSVKTESFLFQDVFVLQALGAIVLVITFFAGFYPAMVLSGFHPLEAIKNKLTSTRSAGKGFQLRQLLVVFQFSITQIFVIATFVVVSQMEYFQNVNLGFDRQAVINIPAPGDERRQKVLMSELQDLNTITHISLSSTVPSGAQRHRSYPEIRRVGWQSALVLERQWVDSAYLPTYGIELVAGRNFHASDSVNRIIINETLAAKLEFASPQEAVGQPVQLGDRNATVIGVIRDFHSKSLREEVDKVVLAQNPQSYALASIKLMPSVNGEGLGQTLQQIEQVWASIYPESVFDYQFFDESIEAYYEEERKFASLFQVFSVVFLLIGCLGLYGLISFVVHKKLKEVAVRKVFGAGIWDILVLISRDYLRLIFIAFAIAAPVAFYFMQRWLENFAYHIEINWWILVTPGLAVVLIAMLTVSGQTMKAARANPAKILKDE